MVDLKIKKKKTEKKDVVAPNPPGDTRPVKRDIVLPNSPDRELVDGNEGKNGKVTTPDLMDGRMKWELEASEINTKPVYSLPTAFELGRKIMASNLGIAGEKLMKKVLMRNGALSTSPLEYILEIIREMIK